MPDPIQRAMPPSEAWARLKELGGGLWKAVTETPARLRRVYGQQPAPGVQGRDPMGTVANTMGQGARGLGKATQQVKKLGK